MEDQKKTTDRYNKSLIGHGREQGPQKRRKQGTEIARSGTVEMAGGITGEKSQASRAANESAAALPADINMRLTD